MAKRSLRTRYSAAADAIGDLEITIAACQKKLSESKAFLELQRLQTQYAVAEETLRKKLGYVKGEIAEEESSVVGKRFRVTLSKSANSTTVINKKGLLKWIEENFSKTQLMDFIEFGTAKLRSYLPKNVFDTFTKTERTGNRKLVVKPFKSLG